MSRREPTETPRPLPHGILAELLGHGRVLLCLDYDGTLSEIVPNPALAFPLARARDALAILTRHPERIAVAVVSGREIEVVKRLLGLSSGILFAGAHGLELVASDGRRRHPQGIEESNAELDAVRSFLARAVPRQRGFIIEDKRVAIALHYRNADPAEARELLLRFERFVAENTPRLEIMRGNMVHEVLARGLGGKGAAVEFVLEESGATRRQTAYFGDDTTDEDAFFALRDDDAVTVLVGPERKSFAKYRVAGPSQVADLLAELAAQLEAGRP